MDFSKRQLVVLCLQYVDDNRNIHTEFTRSCYTCDEISSVIRMLCVDLRDISGMDNAARVLLKWQSLQKPDCRKKNCKSLILTAQEFFLI